MITKLYPPPPPPIQTEEKTIHKEEKTIHAEEKTIHTEEKTTDDFRRTRITQSQHSCGIFK